VLNTRVKRLAFFFARSNTLILRKVLRICEEHFEKNRQCIRKLRTTSEYKQQEKEYRLEDEENPMQKEEEKLRVLVVLFYVRTHFQDTRNIKKI
jgi:hypothetical protein